jgi:hypothetical protein
MDFFQQTSRGSKGWRGAAFNRHDNCLTIQLQQNSWTYKSLFPKFYRTRYFSSYKARVFKTSCHYDMIIGFDMLWAMGLIVDFKDNLMTWDDIVVTMKMYPKKQPLPNEPLIVSQMILDLIEDDLITMDECLSSDILQSKYEPPNIWQIAQGQKQLMPSQCDELEEILLKFPKLFSGGLQLPRSRRCSRTRYLIRMDCGNFHTQEGWTCSLGIQFSWS